MKKRQSILLLLSAVVFSSCYTATRVSYKNLQNVQRGMFPEEVIAIMGEPTFRSFDEKGEVLEFRSYNMMKVVEVRFVDDKVVEMKSYLDVDNHCLHGDRSTKEMKKDKDSKADSSVGVHVTNDGKHLIRTGSVLVTPEGKHEIVVSEHAGMIITASGKHILVH